MIKEIESLETELAKVPGIGKKTAKRTAFAMVARDNGDLVSAINNLNKVGECKVCNNLTTERVCNVCSDKQRDHNKICVVTTIVDLERIESGKFYNGVYFVIKKNINPKCGVGPDDLNLEMLDRLLAKETELILATDATISGHLTGVFIKNKFENRVGSVTRLSTGIPLGASIDYIDIETIKASFDARK